MLEHQLNQRIIGNHQKEMDKNPQVIEAFDRLKILYRNTYSMDSIFYLEQELKKLQNLFQAIGHNRGVLYVNKARAICYVSIGDSELVLTSKLIWYRRAHEIINATVKSSTQIGWLQPSFVKHQAQIKLKSADLYRLLGDYSEARLLETEAISILHCLIKEYPDYINGVVAYATASIRSISGKLRSVDKKLRKTEKSIEVSAQSEFRSSDYREADHILNEIEALRMKLQIVISTLSK